MNLLQQYQEYIISQNLFPKEKHLLIAVSGGADSVVLCHLTREAGYGFSIAHCNFCLRGEESDRDEAFVRSLAHQMNVPFYIKKFSTRDYVADHAVSLQVAARHLRYAWFKEIVEGEWKPENKNGRGSDTVPDLVLTAHHADDNIETLLMNFFKGSGIKGLQGIPVKNKNIIRPLLFATKADVLEWASLNNIQWIEDSSNQETKYTRNYLRHQIIPVIEKTFPQIKENLTDSIKRFGDIELLYRQAIEIHKKKLLEYKDDEVHIPVMKLKNLIPLETVFYEIIKDYGFSAAQVGEALKLLQSATGKYIRSHTHQLLRNRSWLIMTPLHTSQPGILTIEKETEAIVFENGKLEIREREYDNKPFSRIKAEFLDAKNLQYPLILRKWKAGDYFYPLGMRKKKKLSRFLIDQKIPQHQKEKTWVLESAKKIIWVVGLRIDDRFKVTPNTKKIIEFSLSSL